MSYSGILSRPLSSLKSIQQNRTDEYVQMINDVTEKPIKDRSHIFIGIHLANRFERVKSPEI
jgi:CRISPR/Cas system CMR-associated protein Cmr1 (group 7 of RAMP superfamily)